MIKKDFHNSVTLILYQIHWFWQIVRCYYNFRKKRDWYWIVLNHKLKLKFSLSHKLLDLIKSIIFLYIKLYHYICDYYWKLVSTNFSSHDENIVSLLINYLCYTGILSTVKNRNLEHIGQVHVFIFLVLWFNKLYHFYEWNASRFTISAKYFTVLKTI